MAEPYIPYETMARAIAEDAISPPPTAIKMLTPDVVGVILELLSSSYARGVQDGFTMSDNLLSEDPTATVSAYNAGM